MAKKEEKKITETSPEWVQPPSFGLPESDGPRQELPEIDLSDVPPIEDATPDLIFGAPELTDVRVDSPPDTGEVAIDLPPPSQPKVIPFQKPAFGHVAEQPTIPDPEVIMVNQEEEPQPSGPQVANVNGAHHVEKEPTQLEIMNRMVGVMEMMAKKENGGQAQ